jgi:hypothetical protein
MPNNPYLQPDRRPLSERGAMWTPDEQCTVAELKKRPDVQRRIHRNYLGALSLLGRIAELVPRHDLAERTSLDQAFIDANELFRREGSALFYERNSRGGYSLFDVPEASGEKSAVNT